MTSLHTELYKASHSRQDSLEPNAFLWLEMLAADHDVAAGF